MDTLICPYCDSEVKISMVEAEEGCCPECGSSISTAAPCNSYDDDTGIDDDDNSYDGEDNDFGDDFDEDIDDEEYEDVDEEDDDRYV